MKVIMTLIVFQCGRARRLSRFCPQVGRTVLRVKDFTWHPGYMELVEAELDEAMRGEVNISKRGIVRVCARARRPGERSFFYFLGLASSPSWTESNLTPRAVKKLLQESTVE